MKRSTRAFFVAAIGLIVLMPFDIALAFAGSPGQLSAEWWQWALSIPTAVNPMLDTGGADCMVGQRDSVWFLAGMFFGGTATRTCSVPEGVSLYFPVINSVNFNTPNVCGQQGDISAKDLRAFSAAFVDGASNLAAELDGRAISLQRVRSDVFEVALSEDNVFDAPCTGLGNVPAGVYSPAVDDGFYASISKLNPGIHHLHFHAENQSAGFTVDMTYTLVVVPVSSK